MWHAVLAGAGLGSGCREKWLCTWGRRFLDKVERNWSCWRHPKASRLGGKVASAMDDAPHKAPKATFSFLERGCGRVGWLAGLRLLQLAGPVAREAM